MGDASVHFVGETVDFTALIYLSQIGDSQTVSVTGR
jgi:hypothetical protein